MIKKNLVEKKKISNLKEKDETVNKRAFVSGEAPKKLKKQK